MLEWKDYGAPWPDVPYTNFGFWLDGIEEMWNERDAILHRTGKQIEFTRWTFRFFAAQCRRIARGLVKAGVKKGDRVALWAENSPEWMAVWIGAVITGAIIVPIDNLCTDKECVNILEMTGVRAFFYSERKQPMVGSFLSRGLDISSVLSVCIDHDRFAAFGNDAGSEVIPPPETIAANDPASIVFTSGTTGFAKGVTLGHRGIILNSSAAIRMLKAFPGDVFVTVLPLHHTYPTTCSFISPLTAGASSVIVEKLVGKVVIDDCRDSRGTFLIAVPLLFDKLKDGIEAGFNKVPFPIRAILDWLRRIALKKANEGNFEFGQKVFKFIRKKAGMETIRLTVAGGGALSSKTADFFDSFGFNIVHGYGLSENGPLVCVNSPWFKRNVSVGLPVKYTEVKVIDPDSEGIGELAVKSPSIMLGYYKNPDATKEVITPDGWLLSGDYGRIDSDGFVYISGRKKSLIVSSGGKNIYPEEIEGHFDGSRMVRQILVLGRDSDAGEQVVAIVVPDREFLSAEYPGKIPVEGDLDGDSKKFIRALIKKEVEDVNRTLPGYKKISDFLLRFEEFEMNAQHKIRRFLYKDYAAK
ncbi:MAG: AMP-binding protein [Treponema sp.]|jgi:long-chain acyl-CoA synthetase|nr:AMP-binding protein [Treponema sp.]